MYVWALIVMVLFTAMGLSFIINSYINNDIGGRVLGSMVVMCSVIFFCCILVMVGFEKRMMQLIATISAQLSLSSDTKQGPVTATGPDLRGSSTTFPISEMFRTPEQLSEWLDERVLQGIYISRLFWIEYKKGCDDPQPVDITLFDKLAIHSEGDLVFKNAGGDTVSIHCPDLSQAALQYQSSHSHISFMRLKVQVAHQLHYSLRLLSKETQGFPNSITPDDYVSPDSDDELLVNIPVNYLVSETQTIGWTICPEQEGKKILMKLFILK